MPMTIRYYIATKEDKVGTVYSVVEYDNDQMYEVSTGKVDSKGIDALKDITKRLIRKDVAQNVGGYSRLISVKVKNVDDAVHIGNMLDKDKEFESYRKDKRYVFFASPSVFLSDIQKMHKAESSLDSYLIMRDYYMKQGKIH